MNLTNCEKMVDGDIMDEQPALPESLKVNPHQLLMLRNKRWDLRYRARRLLAAFGQQEKESTDPLHRENLF